MTLDDAAEAFIAGWTALRRLHGPAEVERRDAAAWMHDPSGRRMGELIGVDVAPERLVAVFPKGARGAIGAIVSPGASIDAHKAAYRALGWRLLRTEPAFVHFLKDLPPLDPRAVRAIDAAHVARVAQAARMRPASMGASETGDAEIRLYETSVEGINVGWVRSVKAGPDAWVSALNVREEHRRQGLGTALMAALLHDDARLGRRTSVLLASHTGALLYPRLGYERVGTLMSLMPIKAKTDQP